jgi:hypothetical protein
LGGAGGRDSEGGTRIGGGLTWWLEPILILDLEVGSRLGGLSGRTGSGWARLLSHCCR